MKVLSTMMKMLGQMNAKMTSFIKFLFSCLINDKFSIRFQLYAIFAILCTVGVSITLGICDGLIISLGKSAHDTVESAVVDAAKTNVQTLALAISSDINQQLLTTSQSVCLALSLYANLLTQKTQAPNIGDTLMAPQTSYKEYHFVAPCSYPDCPADFSPFTNASNFPLIPNFPNGSLSHTSVYLYSSDLQSSIHTDTDWTNTLNANPIINATINGQAYLDSDLTSLFDQGPNSAMMFYATTLIGSPSAASYNVVHRTFPGIPKNSTTYDPASREWFRNAPVNGIHVFGPYKESFTRQLVITLSSRQESSPFGATSPLTFVSGAVILISELSAIISNVQYSNNGFGALIKASTKEVLVWSSRQDLYDDSTQQFKKLSDIDPQLASMSLTTQSIVEYSDSSGTTWFVSVVPFFESASYIDSTTTTAPVATLLLLIFSQKVIAESSIYELDKEVQNTSNRVFRQTGVVLGITVGAMVLLIILIVTYITSPLQNLKEVSERVVQMASEEELHRDYYSIIMTETLEDSQRRDEIGTLAHEYFVLLRLLHNNHIEKLNTPKYPANPFYVSISQRRGELHWKAFYEMMLAKHNITEIPSIAPNTSGETGVVLFERNTGTTTAAELDKPSPANKPLVAAPLRIRSHRVIPTGDSVTQGEKGAVSAESDMESGSLLLNNNKEQPQSSTAPTAMKQQQPKYVEYCPPRLQPIPISNDARKVSTLLSLRFKLYLVSFLFFGGLIATTVVTISTLKSDADNWRLAATASMESRQIENLVEVSHSQSDYVKSKLQQFSLDLLMSASFFGGLLRGELARPNFASSSDYYLPSYSLDTLNPYSAAASFIGSTAFSGYFVASDTGCMNTADNCSSTEHASRTELLSILDLKWRSNFYAETAVSFVQFGMDSDGFTKYLPYRRDTTHSRTVSCNVDDTSTPYCLNLYMTSSCNPAYTGVPFYPIYEARCRSWYATAVQGGDPSMTYFQYPRKSSGGTYVLTVTAPIRATTSPSSPLHGVLISNYLISDVSAQFNSIHVLKSGYVYLIDANAPSFLIVHPHASISCSKLNCAEEFTSSEYADFSANVLQGIRLSTLPQRTATYYTKGGEQWVMVYTIVAFGSIRYAMISTVQMSEILQSSRAISDALNLSIFNLIVIFSIVLACFCFCFGFFTKVIVSSILDPLAEIQSVFDKARNADLSGHMPTTANSSDLKLLLQAFSNLMIALRFDSESYARGSQTRAKETFSQALQLFTSTDNLRGIGVSLNNLAAAELVEKNCARAIELYKSAVANGETMLATCNKETPYETLVLVQRTLSDRRGNLALAYLESGDLQQAFNILEGELISDKKKYYVRGCVVKEGVMGHYYLKQGELTAAAKTFESVLEFVNSPDPTTFSPQQWRLDETESCKQIALYNMACLLQAKQLPFSVIEAKCLSALSEPLKSDTTTATKILLMLKEIFDKAGLQKEAQQVVQIASKFSFQLAKPEVGGEGEAAIIQGQLILENF